MPLSPHPEHTGNVQPLPLLLKIRGVGIIQPFCCEEIQAKAGEGTGKVALSGSANLSALSPCQKEPLHKKQIFSKVKKSDPDIALHADAQKVPLYI